MAELFDILSCSKAEIEQYLTSVGEPKYRAKQIFTWLHSGKSFDEMTNVPKSLREQLKENAIIRAPEIEEKYVSRDGTVKYLLRLFDGELIEAVFMKYNHGNTVCISSEAGCPMGCKFCASTLKGLTRKLTPSEMLGQVLTVEKDTKQRVSNIVMMGIGEPLDNYDNTVKFLRLVSDPDGMNIGLRHISVSTCGIVPGINKLRDEGMGITLSISLHASDDETRSSIMPVNKKYPIAELLDACYEYFDKTGRRISFEYTMIKGVNDSPVHAERLGAVLRRHMKSSPVHVNLIPVNTVKERGFVRSDEATIVRFIEILAKRGITATKRRSLGSDINASCGQLRNSKNH
ncbi:MAG: 23S rRNA (adenine(2503)-C(2))-methyltransferase RlmN [Clostridia bacterium]|nr:23S rRNA (adenine(2503)-C(2))-methyltransferase RlmN [Clostridia bacterium]